MRLHDLKPAAGSTTQRKRKGRGVGSGLGKTAGRGSKGQNARSGGGVRAGYEGGQMPLHRRLPKRGFTNIFKKEFAVINVTDLAKFESGSTVDPAALVDKGLLKGRRDGVKLLGQGDISVPLTVKLNAISRVAREKIEAAGGTVEVI
ncbi:50S ribosomal protein L15 [Desulfatitalea alkaliphila]|uniref:Large ribosomal subunit protein uL15 n=1 Tax=Desulfatitalea alkaliphila TaxID=2929485 RepID=A0AA41R5W3_9BACT|nr:50S ribosomal protein L15 [Desulfatitalea alkaliphila]MCJ8502929.1 50S ribosomal protein L15 [Desulfatitalea alkaliphila]